jgi:hypothetical protein
MSRRSTDALVAALCDEARPVAPLAPPLRRAAMTLAPVALAGAVLVLVAGDVRGMLARYSGRETLMAVEMGAMLATALLAVAGAFMLSVPGRSRGWLIAPLPTFAIWVGAAGLGCYRDLAVFGPDGWRLGEGECLIFILAAGARASDRPAAGRPARRSRRGGFGRLPAAVLPPLRADRHRPRRPFRGGRGGRRVGAVAPASARGRMIVRGRSRG